MKNHKNRVKNEKKTVELMIRIYCRHAEGNKELCRNCSEVRDYALTRLDRCRYGDDKPACQQCSTPCYKPAMREEIRKIMRFSGPRMILYAPLTAIKHILKIN